MANPHSRRLFLIGATVLTTSAPVLADNSSEKAPEASTVVIGPAGPTPAELVKLEAATAAQAVAPADQNAVPIMHPTLPKPAEVTTIVIGPSVLTPQELAKVTAQVAPAPIQTIPASTSTPASTTTTAPAEK